MDATARYLPGVSWFSDAVNEGSISSMLLLAGVSLLLYALIFTIVSRSYRMINSRMMSGSVKHRAVTEKEYRSRNIYNSIAFKEFKRLLGSTGYAVNAGLGFVFMALVTVVLLFINLNKLLKGALPVEFDPASLACVMAPVSYFMLGMAPTTACSTSLEGKNYWILKTLPVDMFTIYKGKMLFNIYLTVPIGILSVVAGCFSLRAPLVDYILGIFAITAMCSFSTAFGMVTGSKFKRLDWDNEMEVIKQGTAMTLYILPNMLFTGIIATVTFIISISGHGRLFLIPVTIFYAIMASVCYFGVKAIARHE